MSRERRGAVSRRPRPTPAAPFSAPRRLPVALRLLLAITPSTDREHLCGDLLEERSGRRDRDGEVAARRWLTGQALASIPSLLALQWRRAEIVRPLLLAELLVALPLAALDRLWAFTLSQVPLRADSVPTWQLATTLFATSALAAVAGWSDASATPDRRAARRIALPATTAAATAVAVAFTTTIPPTTCAILLIAVPLAAVAGARHFDLQTSLHGRRPHPRRTSP